MLEVNSWFFVMVLNFLALLFVLNIILFRPLLKVFKEREDAIDGALAEAATMHEQKDKLMAEVNLELANAAKQARAKFDELKQEGAGEQMKLMEAASQEAAKTLEGARAELRDEAAKAKDKLSADVERFSDEIVQKLVEVNN